MVSVVVIGGGIIGSSVALEVAKRGHSVKVLEKEKKLGMHQSGRNSGVLHSGINQKPGSLKSQMCVRGNQLAREYCKKKGVSIEECGTLVVARDEIEKRAIRELLTMGKKVGVKNLRIISREELKRIEPEVEALEALYSPNGAIVDSKGFLNAVYKDAMKLGTKYVKGAEVEGIEGDIVKTSKGKFKANHIINCAGLNADRIAHMMGVGKGYTIIPFRGDYIKINNLKVNSMVYQPPDLRYPFLRVHFTKTVNNYTIAGPTATLALGREEYDKGINLNDLLTMLVRKNFWRLILSKEFLKLVVSNAKVSYLTSAFLKEARTLSPNVSRSDLDKFPSGIRAQMVDKKGRMVNDILVEYMEGSTHVLNAVSPGMTCSLAFAEYLVDGIKF